MQEITATIPRHIGFIVDGNRRWAKEHGLPTLEGHRRGYELLKQIAVAAIDRGVSVVSGYIFSTENWKRTETEVSYLMKLALRYAEHDLDEIIAKGIRIRVLGTTKGLSQKMIAAIRRCEAKSAHCTRGTLALCFNYGGTQEIAHACKALITKGVQADEVTPEKIREELYQPDIPDVDIVVRTSGEQRLSNFMLWRVAYSEFLFVDKKWPEMNAQDVDDILHEYARRNRRFGGN
ncbi:MAG TPA: polyprenyl diphosphate synthase [Candidatus Saccharimonadales bacterium]|nr:polyprenyl diphosphate synthase [Candidatus Saccharimonadales bacterium]